MRRVLECLYSLVRDSRGITGLETSVMLVSFVAVASILGGMAV